MEQRWTERISVAVEVMLNSPARGSIKGKSKDISLEGMFVETELARLASDAQLSVTFTLPSNTKKQHKLRAQVVYARDDGVGVIFRGLDVPAISQLRKSLYSY